MQLGTEEKCKGKIKEIKRKGKIKFILKKRKILIVFQTLNIVNRSWDKQTLAWIMRNENKRKNTKLKKNKNRE